LAFDGNLDVNGQACHGSTGGHTKLLVQNGQIG